MPATIFSGNNVKALKSNLDLNGVTKILSVNADPASGAGVAAPLGSIAMDYLAGKVYKKTGSLDTEWQELGSGIGGINYIENSDAESGTSGWSTYADAAGSAPVDGTGGTANITWSRSTTSPLRGVADFNLVKDAVNRQGQGVSYDFTIDSADQAKILTISADYEVLSGTFATGDLAVYVIQDPAGTPVVLQPAGYQVTAATVGNKVRLAATFQTASNVTSYRLCIHVASVSALAYTLAFDSIAVSPQQVVYGAPVTDWQAYTPTFTGLGTVTGVEIYHRRVGDKLEIKGRFTQGTGTATEARMSLPAGLTAAGTDKIPSITIAGLGTLSYSSTAVPTLLTEPSVAYLTFGAQSSTTSGITKVLGNQFLTPSGVLSFTAQLPILGWSSSVVVSSSTDTRVVAAKSRRSANQTIPNATPTVVLFDTTEIDTHGSMNTSGVYTIPVSGIYEISGQIAYGAIASAAGYDANIRLFINGVDSDIQSSATKGTATQVDPQRFFFRKQLNAGQTVAIRAYHGVAAGLTLLGDTTVTGISALNIVRLSGPSQIAASETVAARYADTSGQAIGTSLGIFKFATKDFDTHGGMNTSSGVYTAAISGKYSVDVGIFTQAILLSSTQALVLAIYKNGALFSYIGQVNGNGAGVNQHIQGHDIVSLNAGDTISVYISSSVAGAANTTAGTNHFAITRIGN